MSASFGPLATVDAVELEAVTPVDCRWVLAAPDAGRVVYQAGHIPGAVYVSLDDDLSDMSISAAGRHPLPSKERFAATLGRLGIGATTRVLAYDDAGGAFASRLWWMMRWLGHDAVAVLDGGIGAWVGADLPLEVGTVSLPITRFPVRDDSMPFVGRADVEHRADDAVLVDARAPERFRGETEPLDPVAGHIPGARNAPFGDNLRDGRFLAPDDLGERFARLGVGDAADAIVYCGSGVTACHDILAMEVAGLGTAALYPGSWSEWSRSDGAVATSA